MCRDCVDYVLQCASYSTVISNSRHRATSHLRVTTCLAAPPPTVRWLFLHRHVVVVVTKDLAATRIDHFVRRSFPFSDLGKRGSISLTFSVLQQKTQQLHHTLEHRVTHLVRNTSCTPLLLAERESHNSPQHISYHIMGKGGEKKTVASTNGKSRIATVPQSKSTSTTQRPLLAWKSPYNPLDPNAPAIPTKGEIRAVIPAHCFQRSYFWSTFYVLRDVAMAAALAYATSQVLSSTQVPTEPLAKAAWVAGWLFYAFWMGTIWWGMWVLGHECGHGAFSPSQTYNDIMGYSLHQFLLTPYFAWQYSHAKHHRRTNHLVDGESFVPTTKTDIGLGPNYESVASYAAWHEAIGDGPFAAFLIGAGVSIGWLLYLTGTASTGHLSYTGEPLKKGQIADHFRPNSPMFPPKMFWKITMSTIGILALFGTLVSLMIQYGALPVFLWYWAPYFVVNGWLVLYTWMHHTDPTVPHYGDGEWSWVRGALGTIDRDYGIFDFFHHTIGSTHVVHHLFHELPWYHADEATAAIKAFLEPKGLYNFDPTPWYIVPWKIATKCHYVEDSSGIQYYKSFEDLPKVTKKQA